MRRIRVIVILVAVIVIGVVAITFFRTREPRYQGRTLSEWVESAEEYSETDLQWQNASHAVKQMASNAIPILLDWVRSEDSPVREKVIVWINQKVPLRSHVKLAFQWHYAAMTGFALLGNEAQPAWPALVKLTSSANEQVQIYAFSCLTSSKADRTSMLTALTHLLHDSGEIVQFNAATEFSERFPQEAEAAGVYEMFPNLKGSRTNQPTTNQPPANK